MKTVHSFHIPVMGTGFSIDTPIKVARYGISSVISLVDDSLIEDMRKYYCQMMGDEYLPITKYEDDFRARRITAYLDLVDRIVQKQFTDLKNSRFEDGSEITKYFRLLSDHSPFKKAYHEMLEVLDPAEKEKLQLQLREAIIPGEINVNIMTKLDRNNYDNNGNELPLEYSDALAALRGFAKSRLNSSVVFSAGINRRLYSYVDQFKDFYADDNGFIRKKIILKVSDYRSAMIQGKFFAKKGLWVSEYRIESGLNCGGHAFASDGYLLGPILEEFRHKKHELIDTLHQISNEVLKLKDMPVFNKPHEVKITTQGGIGTYKEDRFLLDYYKVDGTGWATPFLLVPEVTNVDPSTLEKLSLATEDDLFLSDDSPLGVPFHNLRTSDSNLEREQRVLKGRPGSACPKGHLVSNKEFTTVPICTASRQYQKLKIEELNTKNLDPQTYQNLFKEVVTKSCICNDLGAAPIINHHLAHGYKQFTAVCPGPNIAYFSKISTLEEMVNHIYGRINLLNSTYRPHMFIKELKLYIDYFFKEVQRDMEAHTNKQKQYWSNFKNNLFEGIEYYKALFPKMNHETPEFREKMLEELQALSNLLHQMSSCDVFILKPAFIDAKGESNED